LGGLEHRRNKKIQTWKPSLEVGHVLLRNQVDMCLGVYMMSDWPDDLRLCVCCVE
jgi:hypothetical protein